jgi:hypothetical protein
MGAPSGPPNDRRFRVTRLVKPSLFRPSTPGQVHSPRFDRSVPDPDRWRWRLKRVRRPPRLTPYCTRPTTGLSTHRHVECNVTTTSTNSCPPSSSPQRRRWESVDLFRETMGVEEYGRAPVSVLVETEGLMAGLSSDLSQTIYAPVGPGSSLSKCRTP